jgi:hypothetical protein
MTILLKGIIQGNIFYHQTNLNNVQNVKLLTVNKTNYELIKSEEQFKYKRQNQSLLHCIY